jgi:GTPase SAR1 family protein
MTDLNIVFKQLLISKKLYIFFFLTLSFKEDWDTLRVMAYPDTDVILLCFSLVRRDSMENVKLKWMPELNKFLPNALIILVGTQADLRESNQAENLNSLNRNQLVANPVSLSPDVSKHVSTREGEELRKQIGAYKYIECSALTQYNIKDVFDMCIEAYTNKTASRPSCFETFYRQIFLTIRRSLARFRRNNSSSSPSSSSSKSAAYKYSN